MCSLARYSFKAASPVQANVLLKQQCNTQADEYYIRTSHAIKINGGRLAYSWKDPEPLQSRCIIYLRSNFRGPEWRAQHVTNMILLYHLMTRLLTQRNLWTYRVTLRSHRSILECALLVTTYCRSHLFSADSLEKVISWCQTDNMLKSSTGVEQTPLSKSGHKHNLRWREKDTYHVIGNCTVKACLHSKNPIYNWHRLTKPTQQPRPEEHLGRIGTGDAPVNVGQFRMSLQFKHHRRPKVWAKSSWSVSKPFPQSFPKLDRNNRESVMNKASQLDLNCGAS